eukprot:jgi/Bigna1/85922/estExt_fgenesh1_pg.C_70026
MRSSTFLRRPLRGGGLFVLGVHQYDTWFGDRVFNRNLKAIWAAILTTYDYKFGVDYENPESLSSVHSRVAQRWFNVCGSNGGLYIKLGQSCQQLNHVLPVEFTSLFSQMFDSAPPVSSEAINRVFKSDFDGKSPDEVFREFDPNPVASASIAQVHKAIMQDGTKVAVKIQKPYIERQIPWDLTCYRFLIFALEKIFDLPMYWTTDAVCKSIRQEADFRVEASNAEKARIGIDPSSNSTTYIPKIHHHLTTKRVLTMEWIDGVRITDKDGVRQMGFSIPKDDVMLIVIMLMFKFTIMMKMIFPSVFTKVMDMVVKTFAEQIFLTGFIHADPHPGNVLVRPNPEMKSAPQIVLLDHGLYVEASEKFRMDYCKLWKAMVLMDTDTVRDVCLSWGVADSEFFASMQLLKPYRPQKKAIHVANTTIDDILRMQMGLKERVKHLLHDTQLVPRELILLGRNMNIVRSCNKAMGSPVNRVAIMAYYANRGTYSLNPLLHHLNSPASTHISEHNHQVNDPWHQIKWKAAYTEVLFRAQLFFIKCAYYSTKVWQMLNSLFGHKSKNFEELLEEGIANTIEAKLGFRINLDENGNAFG